ncbi:hypothetical protein ACLOJK_030933 [Asimina triloba]
MGSDERRAPALSSAEHLGVSSLLPSNASVYFVLRAREERFGARASHVTTEKTKSV